MRWAERKGSTTTGTPDPSRPSERRRAPGALGSWRGPGIEGEGLRLEDGGWGGRGVPIDNIPPLGGCAEDEYPRDDEDEDEADAVDEDEEDDEKGSKEAIVFVGTEADRPVE